MVDNNYFYHHFLINIYISLEIFLTIYLQQYPKMKYYFSANSIPKNDINICNIMVLKKWIEFITVPSLGINKFSGVISLFICGSFSLLLS